MINIDILNKLNAPTKAERLANLAEVLKMTPSAISHQLKTLQRSKLVKSRREGRSVYYTLADDHVRTIISQGMEHIQE